MFSRVNNRKSHVEKSVREINMIHNQTYIERHNTINIYNKKFKKRELTDHIFP